MFKTIPAQIQNKEKYGEDEEIPLTQIKQRNDNMPVLNLAAVEAILSSLGLKCLLYTNTHGHSPSSHY